MAVNLVKLDELDQNHTEMVGILPGFKIQGWHTHKSNTMVSVVPPKEAMSSKYFF